MEKYMGHCFQVLGGNDEQINHTKTDMCSICELVCVSVCVRERFSETQRKTQRLAQGILSLGFKKGYRFEVDLETKWALLVT